MVALTIALARLGGSSDLNIPLPTKMEGLKEPMRGLEISEIPEEQLLQIRGW